MKTLKIGRNDPCPCGSGKKYKKCCEAPGQVTTSSSLSSNQNGSSSSSQNQASRTTELLPSFQLGLKQYQAGNLIGAEATCQQLLARDPNHADALHLLGLIAFLNGKPDAGMELINRAIASSPRSAQFHNNLGSMHLAEGRHEQAIMCFQTALRYQPDFVDAQSNLGIARYKQRDFEAAIKCYQACLQINPELGGVHNNLGLSFQAVGHLAEALASFRTALRIKPDWAEIHNNLGNILREQGQLAEAMNCYQQAISLKPDYAEPYNSLGMILSAQDQPTQAIASYQKAIALRPDLPEPHNNLGVVMKSLGKLEMALDCYQAALRLNPDFAEGHNNMGSVLDELGRPEEAKVSYQRALAYNPRLAGTCNNLGNLLYMQGDVDAALAYYKNALEIEPNVASEIYIATAFPVIADSMAGLLEARQQIAEQISFLMDRGLILKDPSKEIARTNFYLAYEGLNDLKLQKQMADLYLNACPSLAYVAPHCAEGVTPVGRSKIRIGLLSRLFKEGHIVSKVVRGTLANLSREHLSVHVFSFGKLADEIENCLHDPNDSAVQLPASLAAARERIAQEKLDILLYADVGMDSFTYFLAFSRLAPVQCTWGGHPCTTGIPNMDYFISFDLAEPKNAQDHYSERLVRLKSNPFYCNRSHLSGPPKTRSDYNFDNEHHIYLCPMTPFKFHPEFDEVMADILRLDPAGRIVVVDYPTLSYQFKLLFARWRKAMPDVVDRIRSIDRQTASDFLHLLVASDAVLDTLHFSGGSTSLEAMAVGAPMVTLPGDFFRGRSTYVFYKQMGLMDCVASDKKDYVRIAVRLATDSVFRDRMKTEILARNSVLYENLEGVKELEKFLIAVGRQDC